MARPSNYRHDPFNDTSTAVPLTERHLIPAVSPFTVELNEVPVKNNPTTTSVKYISIEKGAVVFGGNFDEVAAFPTAGQFYPDYNTNADGNESWNTGTLMFSAADAGKMIEVTYQAKGTLTGVSSNTYPSWWLDRGDGSDGDFFPTENVAISGRKNYRNVYIPKGVTVQVKNMVNLCVQGSCVVDGVLSARGQGCDNDISGNCGFGGATYNGKYVYSYHFGFLLNIDESIINMFLGSREHAFGSGGSRGTSESAQAAGKGGGSIRIVAKNFGGNGEINAAGTDGLRCINLKIPATGGGGGGSIGIVAERNGFSGKINISGGAEGGGTGKGGFGPANKGGDGWYRIIELGVE